MTNVRNGVVTSTGRRNTLFFETRMEGCDGLQEADLFFGSAEV